MHFHFSALVAAYGNCSLGSQASWFVHHSDYAASHQWKQMTNQVRESKINSHMHACTYAVPSWLYEHVTELLLSTNLNLHKEHEYAAMLHFSNTAHYLFLSLFCFLSLPSCAWIMSYSIGWNMCEYYIYYV